MGFKTKKEKKRGPAQKKKKKSVFFLFLSSLFCGVKTGARRLRSNGSGDEKSRSPGVDGGGEGRREDQREATNEG